MRPLVLAVGLSTVITLSGAHVNTSSAQEQSARLRVGETVRVGGANASLTFEAVQRDSRCPKGARCIRAGEAVVVFRLREASGETSMVTFEVPPGGGATHSSHGYRIDLVALDPQAATDVEIAPADYVATINIQTQ